MVSTRRSNTQKEGSIWLYWSGIFNFNYIGTDLPTFPIISFKRFRNITYSVVFFFSKLASLKIVSLSVIEEKWKDLSLPVERFQEICRIGNFANICEWRWFLALAASDLCAVSLFTLSHTEFTIIFVLVNPLSLSLLIYP